MNKTLQEKHGELVAALAKPGSDILSSLTAQDCHLIHMVLGVSGEAGELLDAIKKSVIYRKPLDMENVKEEISDIMFYLRGLADALGFDQDTLLAFNIDKLQKRYPNATYSNKDAITRADKETP